MLKIIKLTSGKEILGTIIDENDSSIFVSDPLLINYLRTNSHIPAVTLQRYSLFSNQWKVEFKKLHVETILEPIEGTGTYYENMLQTIKEEVDPGIQRDLSNRNEIDEESSGESYMAMLEAIMSKKPLN